MGIKIEQVSKCFGQTKALDRIDLDLSQPGIYGLLGNNGAGKSTLLNIITNRIFPDSGQVLIDGESNVNNDKVLSRIYLLSEQNLYPEDMRVRDAMKIAAIFYPDFDSVRAQEQAEQFGLDTKKKIKALSTGYSSIFKLIIALNVDTPYLLLDEPVLGLDAQHRDMFYKLLLEDFAARPRIVVISTHLISEVANLIEHTVIIRDGHILRDLNNEQLSASGYTVSGPAQAVDAYLTGKKLLSQSTLGGLKTASLEGEPEQPLPAGLELGRLDLQDYFIQLMNKEDQKHE